MDKKQKDRKWNVERDELLREVVLVKRLSNWNRIAEFFPGTTAASCCKRWNQIRPPHHFEVTERKKWVAAEDELLLKLVERYGTKNWRIIASHLTGRLPKQCRERWINHVDPDIHKGRLSDSDWRKVLEAQKEFGNRWSEIAKLLPGRTPNQIKNHWHAMTRKKYTHEKKVMQHEYPPSPSHTDACEWEPPKKLKRNATTAFKEEGDSSDECSYNDRGKNFFDGDDESMRKPKKAKTSLDILCEMADVLYKLEVLPLMQNGLIEGNDNNVDHYNLNNGTVTDVEATVGAIVNSLLHDNIYESDLGDDSGEEASIDFSEDTYEYSVYNNKKLNSPLHLPSTNSGLDIALTDTSTLRPAASPSASPVDPRQSYQQCFLSPNPVPQNQLALTPSTHRVAIQTDFHSANYGNDYIYPPARFPPQQRSYQVIQSSQQMKLSNYCLPASSAPAPLPQHHREASFHYFQAPPQQPLSKPGSGSPQRFQFHQAYPSQFAKEKKSLAGLEK